MRKKKNEPNNRIFQKNNSAKKNYEELLEEIKELKTECDVLRTERDDLKEKCNRYAKDIANIRETENIKKRTWTYEISFYDVCSHTVEALIDIIICRFETDQRIRRENLK